MRLEQGVGAAGLLLVRDVRAVLAQHVMRDAHMLIDGHHQVHKGIGLPSSRAVDNEQALVDQHDKLFLDEASTLTPTDGALELLADLDSRDVPYLATEFFVDGGGVGGAEAAY